MIRGDSRGEVVHRHDATLALGCREVGQLGEPCALVLQADEPQARVALGAGRGAVGRAADRHAEALMTNCQSF